MQVGDEIAPDAYLDDMSLVLSVKGGIVLLCGCCHAGLRNTIAMVRKQRDAPLLAIVGGTHLAKVEEVELDAIIQLLKEEDRPMLYLNHCTGERALYALAKAFGQRVSSCPAGTVLEF